MTIRGGRRPRDDRSQAHPANPGSPDYAPAPWDGSRQTYASRRANGRATYNGRSNHRGGLGGPVRFPAFALVLPALVLVATLTVLRPVVSGAIAGWAYDNPGALRIPFVADIVRGNLGDALTTPASDDPSEVEFT